jgi:ribose 1,5-bisphosphate isomerase
MSSIDWSKYETIEQIEDDIKTITIQGATNVAIATLEGIKLYTRYAESYGSVESFIGSIRVIGEGLANARPNEPLAKNGVKYLFYRYITENQGVTSVPQAQRAITQIAQDYLDLIKDSKEKIIKNSKQVMDGVDEVFTHCHSSTVENVIIGRFKNEPKLKAVCTETRPLFQGRITARNLVNAGIDTTMVADSSAESFIIGRGVHGVDVVFIGADEITTSGDAINKIGSWGVALASYFASTPLYVVTSILKVDTATFTETPKIEMREAHELWPDAPEKLKLVNPAFEIVDHKFITGFITEEGVLLPDQMLETIRTKYGWMMG